MQSGPSLNVEYFSRMADAVHQGAAPGPIAQRCRRLRAARRCGHARVHLPTALVASTSPDSAVSASRLGLAASANGLDVRKAFGFSIDPWQRVGDSLVRKGPVRTTARCCGAWWQQSLESAVWGRSPRAGDHPRNHDNLLCRNPQRGAGWRSSCNQPAKGRWIKAAPSRCSA